jgi:TRAP-type C4-dicarboxylate transport system permease small subunit
MGREVDSGLTRTGETDNSMREPKKPNVLSRILDGVDLAVAPIVLAIVFVVVLLQILSRVLPGNALPWTLEVGEALLGFIIWFGISVAARNNNHVSFDLLVRRFPPRAKRIIGLIGINLFILYLAWLGMATIELLLHYQRFESRTTILQVNMLWVRLPILIGCLATIIRLAIKDYRVVTNREQVFVSGEIRE